MSFVCEKENRVLRQALDSWFSQEKRAFPWRNDPTPYEVLVSEFMLQQTQASRVLLYFTPWMKQFPSLASLAAASEKEVLKAWEGLGYYRRALSLQKAARIIIEQHEGVLPSDEKELVRIPGIGPYTAGAILSFAFHKRALAIDANVVRVIQRLRSICSDDRKACQQIQAFVNGLLPQNKAWHTMEALIELGALVCKKKPRCEACPLSSWCQAYLRNTFEEPLPKIPSTKLFRDVACIMSQDAFLVVQRTGKQVMSGLYEFPYFDSFPGGRTKDSFLQLLQAQHNLFLCFKKKLPKIVHTFTRFRSSLFPCLFVSNKKFSFPDGIWVPVNTLSSLPFSSGHKKICALLLSKFCIFVEG